MDLLGDLFPGVNPPRKRDMTFEEKCVEAAEGFDLHPDEDFILKVLIVAAFISIALGVAQNGWAHGF